MNEPGPSTTIEKNEFCAVCKSIAKNRCSGCKIVYYCSREHQKSDWRIHSKNCQVFKLVEDPKIGRHYVAMRNIEFDELVICENKPLLSTPNLGITPICLNCYVPLTIDSAKPCEKCGWPLCLECTTHGPECDLTMKYRKRKVTIERFSMPNPLYDAVSVMRALALREKSPKDYEKLLKLQDHCDTTINEWVAGTISWSFVHVARYVKKWMMIDLDVAEIGKIIGVVGINGFKMTTPKKHSYSAVFYKTSYIQNDCNPNCRSNAYYDSDTGGRMIIRAIKTIPKDDPITIIYTNPLWGTVRRRSTLRSTKFFDCTCERCKDPTEFGTMFSAVKCFKTECNGYMLPPSFMVSDYEKIPDYICDKCHSTMSSKTIDEMMENISVKFSQIDQRNANDLTTFIDEHSKILHTNHFYIVKAEMELCGLLDEKGYDTCPSEECLRENIKLCRKLTHLIETLGPVEYAMRGMILFLQYNYSMKLSEIAVLRDPHEVFTLIEESNQLMAKCEQLIRHEIKKPSGEQTEDLARGTREQMTNISKYL